MNTTKNKKQTRKRNEETYNKHGHTTTHHDTIMKIRKKIRTSKPQWTPRGKRQTHQTVVKD